MFLYKINIKKIFIKRLFMKRLSVNNKGSSLLIMGGLMTSLLLMTSFVIDFGAAYLQISKLQNAVDAAALAAASKLPVAVNDSFRTSETINIALDYLGKNGVSVSENDISLTSEVAGQFTGIRVKSVNDVNLYISRIIGIDKLTVDRHSIARVGPASSVRGASPLSIDKQYLDNAILNNQTDHLLLKFGALKGVNGSFGVIDLDGSISGGSSDYEEWLSYGYYGEIKAGSEAIPVETGNMSGATSKAFQTRYDSCTHFLSQGGCTIEHFVPTCKRIVIIPVITYIDAHYVTIDGFAAFILESVGGSGVNSTITGSFVKAVTSGTAGSSSVGNTDDYGVYAKYLVE